MQTPKWYDKAPDLGLIPVLEAFYRGDIRGKDRHRSAPVMRGGKPVLNPRTGRPIVKSYADARTQAVEKSVGGFFRELMGDRIFSEGAYMVRLVIFRRWPDNKPGGVKEGAFVPISKPDTDNCVKTLLDAMNKVVFDDDDCVAGIEAWKHYGPFDGAYVWVAKVQGPRFSGDEIEEMVRCKAFCSPAS